MPKIDVKVGKSGWPGDILVALSASNLALLGVWDQLIYASSHNSYFLPAYTWHSYLASIILLAFLAAVFLSALRVLRTSAGACLRLAAVVALAAYVPLVANALRLLLDFPIAWIIRELSDPFKAVAALLAFSAVLALVWLVRGPLLALAFIVLLVFSPFGLLNVVYAGYEGIALALEKTPPAAAGIAGNPGLFSPEKRSGKTMLVIFDELDYRMVFEEKVPGLEMKNFNYLRGKSLFFSRVHSPFSWTLSAIPGLATGLFIYPYTKGPDSLGVRFRGSGDEATWRTTENLFGVLDEAGKHVALVGYYHPYCRIFGDVVDDCAAYSITEVIEIIPSDSVFRSLARQAASLTPFYRVLNSIEIYERQQRDVFEAIGNDAWDFVYVHFKLPHSPYIYDRGSGKLTIFNVLDGYVDNLQLADVLLGRIIDKLKEENLWDASTLIVSSDHHWREPDEYDGVLSRRVPLIVKLPGQNDMHVSNAELSTLHIKPLVEKIVLDGILDPVELAGEFESAGN